MCGRMTLAATEPLLLAEVFALAAPPDPPPAPRYNLAPTQVVHVVTGDGPRRLEGMRWGLVPSWAEDLKIGPRLINARADTVATKPAFRAAYRRRRCLVAADGWYEWRRTADGAVPFHFRRDDGRPFALAGLWESWRAPDGAEVRSACVITTEPNAVAAEIHDRMPVVLPVPAYELWLAPGEISKEDAATLLRACPADFVVPRRASRRVGNVRNDGPDLLVPED